MTRALGVRLSVILAATLTVGGVWVGYRAWTVRRPSVAANAPIAGTRAQPQTFITTRAAVLLRATPSSDGVVVARLSLGTTLNAVQQDRAPKGWYPVRLGAQGDSRWVEQAFVMTLPVDGQLAIVERVVNDSMTREEDDFPARVELVDFIDQAARDLMSSKQMLGEVRGRFALYRLRAVMRAARNLPSVTDWLGANRELLDWNSAGGSWVLKHEALLSAYERNQGTRAGDDILWEGVTAGLPGECEGDVPCYLRRISLLEGEYLRREPSGRHVQEAVDRVAANLSSIAEGDHSGHFDPASDCDPLQQEIRPLHAALAGVRVLKRETALAALDRLRQTLCRS